MNALLTEAEKGEHEILSAEKYAGKVGAFEGADYQAKGYYRPEVDCIMFTRANYFCAVCRRAIARMIDFYTGK
jgi:IgA Peptidase M64